MLEKLKVFGENQLPWAFALVCPLFDRLIARHPLAEVNFLPLLVSPGDTACDIGANRGLFTYWLLERGVKVMAFEPNPHLVNILKLRFPRALKDGRMSLLSTALSDAPGEATLHIPKGFSPMATIDGAIAAETGRPMEEVKVPLARLDDLVAEDVSFIKLDVEGHELKVVAGAQKLFARSLPSLLVEAEERHRPGAIASLRALLEPMGYKGLFLADGRFQAIEGFDPAIHQREENLERNGTRITKGAIYVNNFFFVARPQVADRLAAWTGA